MGSLANRDQAEIGFPTFPKGSWIAKGWFLGDTTLKQAPFSLVLGFIAQDLSLPSHLSSAASALSICSWGSVHVIPTGWSDSHLAFYKDRCIFFLPHVIILYSKLYLQFFSRTPELKFPIGLTNRHLKE